MAAGCVRGSFSAVDVTQACLDRIAVADGQIGAFQYVDAEFALAQASALDAKRMAGEPLGPLHGVPVGIKDIIDTKDLPTGCGSAVLAGRLPYEDATVVLRLRAAGAVIIGKTVTTEFAYFSPGKTRNPHDLERTPGGSSSGSAAAVAAGLVPVALGSQTNGSVIRPASYCGVLGLKPSHGLISRAGVLTLSKTLDHVGIFSRSLEDSALMLEVLAGYDAADSDTRPISTAQYRAVLAKEWPLTPRFGFVRTPVWGKADASTQAAFENLASSLGEDCVPIDLTDYFSAAWDAHRVIMAVEMANNLGRVADKGGAAVSQVFHDLMAAGRKELATSYLEALDARRTFTKSLNDLFNECNAIITPAARGAAPKGLDATGDPVFCSLWTLTGLPSITLPMLRDDNMPLGVQLVGPSGDDARLLRNANWLFERLQD
jgi:Asp-tRNA(Asn)/Glu-tRNA(Gln) amidotransferase A subunit family amidase